MTTKRYNIRESHIKDFFTIQDEKKEHTFPIIHDYHHLVSIEKTLNEQNERIKKIKEHIDREIKQREDDLRKSIKAGMPTGLMYSEIELLEELQKIVDGDVE